ncbi:S-layer homology domain-containing protein [Bacillus pinisoli]|uniref:S-layer homology domain-containing protein n=1 Tax=Bacillus pinisoli TaxID=2901866 RepID=UPI001FF44296|nr:S-layer homology domain-containing protein [Bacillus pinisoli]
MKKKVIVIICLMIFLIPFLERNVQATDINSYVPMDVSGHWGEGILNDFIDADILKGVIDQQGNLYVKPKDAITRAEFVALLVRTLELKSTTPGKAFTDVPINHWAYGDIQTASALGIVGGVTPTEFAPKKQITRAELAAIIVRAFGTTVNFSGTPTSFTDVPSGYWAIGDINKASQVGIVVGNNGKFSPKASASRAEAVVMLHRSTRLESTALPTDNELQTIVLNNENEVYQAYLDADYYRVFDIAQKYTTGFYLAGVNEGNSVLLYNVEDNGYSYSFLRKSEPVIEVISKSNSFAVVRISNVYYEVTQTKGSEVYKDVVDANGDLLLRKLNGVWKIYSSY